MSMHPMASCIQSLLSLCLLRLWILRLEISRLRFFRLRPLRDTSRLFGLNARSFSEHDLSGRDDRPCATEGLAIVAASDGIARAALPRKQQADRNGVAIPSCLTRYLKSCGAKYARLNNQRIGCAEQWPPGQPIDQPAIQPLVSGTRKGDAFKAHRPPRPSVRPQETHLKMPRGVERTLRGRFVAHSWSVKLYSPLNSTTMSRGLSSWDQSLPD